MKVNDTARQNRIDMLRRAIATGSYRVDADDLAGALIGHMEQNQRRSAA